MSHEFETGLFARGLRAWHGLGKVFPTGHEIQTNARLALKEAGLDWKVNMIPVTLAPTLALPGSFTGQYEPGSIVSGVRAIVRASDGRILGNAGDVPKGGAAARSSYAPLQNEDMADWFQPVLDAKEATIEAAASLFGGQRVYMLARLGHNGDSHASIVEGDEVVNHWLVANDHSGKHSLRIARCRTRVVCANTLASAFSEGTYVKIRHSSRMANTMDELQKIMRKEHAAFQSDIDIFRSLAKVSITRAMLREYVKEVFPESFKEKKETAAEKRAREQEEKRARWAAQNAGKDLLAEIMGTNEAPKLAAEHAAQSDELMSEILERVEELVESGRGSDIKGVRGTLWGAYNAVGEYLQYEYGRGPEGATDKRMDGMLFGQPATWNALALQKAIEFGKGG